MTKIIELRRGSAATVAGVAPENAAFCRARCDMLRHWRAWAVTGLSAVDAGAEIEATREALRQLFELERTR